MLLEINSSFTGLQYAFPLYSQKDDKSFINIKDLFNYALKYSKKYNFFGMTSMYGKMNQEIIKTFLYSIDRSQTSVLIYDHQKQFSEFMQDSIVVHDAETLYPLLLTNTNTRILILHHAHTIRPHILIEIFKKAKELNILLIYSIPIYVIFFPGINILTSTNFFIYIDTKTSGYAYTDKYFQEWLQELDQPSIIKPIKSNKFQKVLHENK